MRGTTLDRKTTPRPLLPAKSRIDCACLCCWDVFGNCVAWLVNQRGAYAMCVYPTPGYRININGQHSSGHHVCVYGVVVVWALVNGGRSAHRCSETNVTINPQVHTRTYRCRCWHGAIIELGARAARAYATRPSSTSSSASSSAERYGMCGGVRSNASDTE